MTNLLTPVVHSNSALRLHTRKVLHVVNGEHYAGAARVQDLLALSLPEFGYDVSFACVLPDRFESERQAQNCPLFNFPMKHRMDWGPARRVARLVQSEGFDLIHSHTTRSAMIGAAAAKLTGIPYIHHVHCQMNTEIGRRIRTLINTAIERCACRTADGVIAVSGSIRSFLLRNHFSEGHVSVVPNGVPAPARPRSPRRPDDSWTIGMIALLRERKGLETLIRTLPSLGRNHHVRLRIVGPFESEAYKKEITGLAETLGVTHLIDWTGFVRNVQQQIAEMDVLVLPSVLPEGMPMVLLEAMAAGVPIVGSHVDGITDVIRHDVNGLLAKPGDVSSLTAQLNRILSAECDWETLRHHCLQDYANNYSAQVMAGNVAHVYDRVLAGVSSSEERRWQS